LSNALQKITSTGPVKTTVTLDLGDCDEAYRGAIFDVWVTPTRAHWAAFAEYVVWLEEEPKRQQAKKAGMAPAEAAEFDRVMGEQLDREMWSRLDAWLADTWLNVELEEVTQIREHLQADFPAAWDWLYNHTLRTMREYRDNLSKN